MSAQTRSAPSEDTSVSDTDTQHSVTVHTGTRTYELEVESGTTLRQALRDHGLSPHNSVTVVANCGGQGHCGVCAVEITEGAPAPDQWLDQGLSAVGAGRLSCQVTVNRNMVVHL